MTIITLIGIDPGLIDTGAVAFYIRTGSPAYTVEYEKIPGGQPQLVANFVKAHARGDTRIFIEKYRDRGTVFSTHDKMRKLEQDLKRLIPRAKLLNNMGVRDVVTDDLLKLLGVWSFTTVTNHQDLRSAARIALLGALKDDDLNLIFTTIVTTLLNSQP